MAAFDLVHLGRNVISIANTRRAGMVVTNTSDRPADVSVHLKNGGPWRPFREPVTLAPGARWSAAWDELGGGLVMVVAQGRDDGRSIVRVEY